MDEPPGFILLNAFSDQSLLYIILTAVFVLFSSWSSAVEAAFFSLHQDDVGRFQNSSDKREQSVALLLKEPRLLLNVLTACKYSALMATASLSVITFFNNDEPKEISKATTVLVLTVLFALSGVILSKIIGTYNNTSMARSNSKFTQLVVKVFKPFFQPLLKTSVIVERKLSVKTEEKAAEEITHALQLATIDNDPIEGEKEILEGIVNFTTTRVKQIMKPKSEISFTDISLSFHDLLEFVKRSGFSRVPVCRDSLNNVEGVLYIKDLLPFLEEGNDYPWQKLLRPGYFTIASKKIDALLKEFQEKRVHMALVLNQQNHTVGIVTLEDIIEEIVGDINDEFDEPGVRYQRLNENNYLFDGKASIHEFCRVLNVDEAIFQPVKGINESLNGVLIEMNGELPELGKKMSIGGLTFVIESVDRKKIKKVSVQIHEEQK